MPAVQPVTLVTGGAHGIGRAVVARLARDGHAVAFCYRSAGGDADAVAAEAAAAGARVFARQADVTDAGEAREFVKAAESELGVPTALVTCAAAEDDTTASGSVGQDGAAQDKAAWHADLDHAYQLCRSMIFSFMKRRAGRVVIVTPALAPGGGADRAAVASGLTGLTRALAKECGSYGVRANVVMPGYIETGALAALDEQAAARLLRRIPAGRFGRPEEVADLVAFLASDQASYIHGAVLRIDGGSA